MACIWTCTASVTLPYPASKLGPGWPDSKETTHSVKVRREDNKPPTPSQISEASKRFFDAAYGVAVEVTGTQTEFILWDNI